MKQIDFSNGRVAKNIAQTALPMLAAQLVHLLYNIVDRVYSGRLPEVGTAALGAVGLCFPFIILITGFTNLYGMGGGPLCAMARGRHDTREAEAVMNVSCALLIVTSLVLILLGELLAVPLLKAFGSSEEYLAYNVPYLRLYLLGTTFAMLGTGLNPFINAEGFSHVAMKSVLVGAVLNILLDPLFMFVFDWGVQGAAVATVISQAVQAFIAVRFLSSGRTELTLHRHMFKELLARGRMITNIVTLGLAAFVMQLTNALVNLVCNRMLAAYGGDLYISVMTVVSSVRQVCETPTAAIAEGASPVLSYNYGACEAGRVRAGMRVTVLSCLIYTTVMWGLIFLFPEFFIRIFSSDESMLEAAVPALHLYFFAFAFQSLQHTGQVVFKALGKRVQNIFFSVFRKVILVVPLTLLLPGAFGLGVRGVFMAEPISNVVGGLACFITMLAQILPELKRMEERKAARAAEGGV